MSDELSRGQTSAYRTHGRTHRQTDAGHDNTRRPKLASGKNGQQCYIVQKYSCYLCRYRSIYIHKFNKHIFDEMSSDEMCNIVSVNDPYFKGKVKKKREQRLAKTLIYHPNWSQASKLFSRNTWTKHSPDTYETCSWGLLWTPCPKSDFFSFKNIPSLQEILYGYDGILYALGSF